MDVRNCRRCNRLFQYIVGRMICPSCKEEEEKEFKRVKDYLYDHPKANMIEVSEATEVPVTSIKHYLREGRLIITNDSPIGIECEKCGATIKTGRFCERCAYELERDMRSVTNSLQNSTKNISTDPKKSRMHYLNKDKIGGK
ncbi:MAG: MerR family transcriptional regulator [Epulopiscium sp.]|mgnify:CR=1 FL=1|nr:MerR family transcriptional regulator [Candidatus Epulonipiscium sp.]